MAMRFPFRRVPLGQPALTAGGALYRLRPIADLSISGPGGTIAREAVFDSGADEVVLPESYAPLIGLDLSQAPTGVAGGVGSAPLLVRYAQVTLRLSDGTEFREWLALVGFTAARRTRVLFGNAQGLEYFTATFIGDRHEAMLEVNGNYPGH